MVSHHVFYQLMLLGLLWLFLMLHVIWPSARPAQEQRIPQPVTPPHKRSKEPKPFAGLTRKSRCNDCTEALETPTLPPPPALPPKITSTRGRRRRVDTAHHFCPDPTCSYGGWLGLGNISANGHPSGGRWRQLYCSRCQGYFLETHGTLLHGKHVAVDLIVRVIGCLAEGIGIRGTARVFEIDPNTVLQWLVEAAEQLRAFSQSILHDLHLPQVQLDELYAVLSAVKGGQSTEDEAIERLSRSPHWVWVTMDPRSKLLIAINGGERTLAMAQHVAMGTQCSYPFRSVSSGTSVGRRG